MLLNWLVSILINSEIVEGSQEIKKLFLALFLKMYLSEVATFFITECLSRQLNFTSGSLSIRFTFL